VRGGFQRCCGPLPDPGKGEITQIFDLEVLMQQCGDVCDFLRIISSEDDVVNIHKKSSDVIGMCF